jgi:hypothetical protein
MFLMLCIPPVFSISLINTFEVSVLRVLVAFFFGEAYWLLPFQNLGLF